MEQIKRTGLLALGRLETHGQQNMVWYDLNSSTGLERLIRVKTIEEQFVSDKGRYWIEAIGLPATIDLEARK